MPREYEGDATGAHSFPWTAVLLGRLDDGWGWCRRWCVGACLSVAWCSGWGSYAYVYYGEAAVVSLVLGLGAQRFGDGLTGWLFSALEGLVARAYLLEPSHWGFRERGWCGRGER